MGRKCESDAQRDDVIHVRMTRKEHVDLKILSRHLGKTCSKIVREALEEYKEKIKSCS